MSKSRQGSGDVIPEIPANPAEEFLQVLGQFEIRETVILGMVFLLEDDDFLCISWG